MAMGTRSREYVENKAVGGGGGGSSTLALAMASAFCSAIVNKSSALEYVMWKGETENVTIDREWLRAR